MHKITLLLVVIVFILGGCGNTVNSSDSINNDATGEIASDFINDKLYYSASYVALESLTTGETTYEITITVENDTRNNIESFISDFGVTNGISTMYGVTSDSAEVTDSIIEANSVKTYTIHVDMQDGDVPSVLKVYDEYGAVITSLTITEGVN